MLTTETTPYRREFEIRGRDFTNAGRVSTDVKAILKEIGFDAGLVRRVAIAAYEAEMNVVLYANHGKMELEVSPERICLVVADEGPGIPDIDLAMREGYSTASDEIREMGFGAGMGLPNIRKNADELDIQSEIGKGTRVFVVVRASEGGAETPAG